ncbi:NAD dependent epimerase/dehydratase family protein [mine drainage metagenome]|uniref:NAD dependent epimerase/dehydratase family protein n=1 Tax=mine drainage metagenome TaxID=410659 RepID=A0A1J5SMU4_9ZZZZ
MERMLIIGCGDIARRTIRLLGKNYRICALIRNGTQRDGLRTQGVLPVMGDLDDRKSLSRITGLADIVLHLAPPPNSGAKDVRTRHLLAALSKGSLPRQFIYISTSGVYGDCAGAWVNETHTVNPQSARAQRRVDAESQIRRWARVNGVRASILRVPGIYAEDRLPLERLRAGMPAIAADEDSYTNHIHADDLARIVVAALHRGRSNRVYHASDDGVMKMGDYFDVVADAHHLPHPRRISRAEAQRAIPESMLSFMNESRRLTNSRMKQELQVRLNHPTVKHFLKDTVHDTFA